MSQTLPPVARSVHVFCKKCETDRYFKVIAHTSATTAKLKCEVCGCSRNLSLDEGKKTTTVRKTGAAKTSATSKSSSSTWSNLKDQYKGPEAAPYSISVQFQNQQSIVHPTFGVGFVTKTHPHKIEVLFAQGLKELIHAKK